MSVALQNEIERLRTINQELTNALERTLEREKEALACCEALKAWGMTQRVNELDEIAQRLYTRARGDWDNERCTTK